MKPQTGAADAVLAGLNTDNYEGTPFSGITALKVRVRTDGGANGPRVVLRTRALPTREACNLNFMIPLSPTWTTFDLTVSPFWDIFDRSGGCDLFPNGSTWSQVTAALPGPADVLDSSSIDGVAGVRILTGATDGLAYPITYVDSFEFNTATSDFEAPGLSLSGAVASIPAGGTIDLPIAAKLSGPNQPGFGNSLGFVSGDGGVTSSAAVSVASSPAGLCTAPNTPVSFPPAETAGTSLGTSFSKVLPPIKVTTTAGAGGTCTFSLTSPVNAVVSGTVTLTVTATPTVTAPPVTPPRSSKPPAVVPTTCKATAVSKKSKIKVDMGPDLPGNGFYRVRIDVKRGGEWFRYLKSAKTQGAQETRTTNVPKGTYRVKCYGPTEAQDSRSGVVKIKK